MILDGERTGKLKPGGTILDSTSGNTGIAYAMIGAARGYKVKLCLPGNASIERKRMLRAYGAEMIFTDPGEGSDGAIRKVREIYEADPDRYFYPDQYNNPANWQAHFDTTGPEIIEQTDGRDHAFRHLAGHQRHFRRAIRAGSSRNCRACSASPRSHRPASMASKALKHMPTAIVPGIYDPTLADRNIWMETEDAYRWCSVWRAKKACWWAFRPARNVVRGAHGGASELHAQGRRRA